MRTIGVDPRTCLLCQFPGIFIMNIGREKRPQGAPVRFDRVNQAAFLLIIVEAEPILSGLDIKTSVSFLTELGRKFTRGEAKEDCNPLRLFFSNKNTTFTKATFAADAAFKGFHNVFLPLKGLGGHKKNVYLDCNYVNPTW